MVGLLLTVCLGFVVASDCRGVVYQPSWDILLRCDAIILLIPLIFVMLTEINKITFQCYKKEEEEEEY